MVGITSAADRASINVNQLVYAEKTLRGSLYGSTQPRTDLLLLIGMHQHGRLMLNELITKRYPLEDINEAYDALQRGEVARSLIVFE
jgi:S-(hydroxymethyl)glutathione dehydrogenase/alcohol dehydrogenase